MHAMKIKVLATIMVGYFLTYTNFAQAGEGKVFFDIGVGAAKPKNSLKNNEPDNPLYAAQKPAATAKQIKIAVGYLMPNKKTSLELSYHNMGIFKIKNSYRSLDRLTINNEEKVIWLTDFHASQNIRYHLFETSLEQKVVEADKFSLSLVGGIGVGISKPKDCVLDIIGHQISFDEQTPIEMGNKTEKSKGRTTRNFTYSVGAKLNYDLTENLQINFLDIRYRKLGTFTTVNTYPIEDPANDYGEIIVSKKMRNKLDIISATAGVRYYF